MSKNRKPFIVSATVDADHKAKPGTPNRWTARAAEPEEMIGIFATGDTFADAREALARNIWLSLKAHGKADEFDSVRVLAITRKTFAGSALATSDEA